MSLRQTCRICGRPDKFDFTVPDAIWNEVLPPPFSQGVVCLFCFDAFAEMRGVDYANGIAELWFAGDKASFRFVPANIVTR